VHVHRAQAAVTVAAEPVVAKHPRAAVLDHCAGAARAGFQGRQRHEGFVGGAWWVGAAQSPVEQGLVDGLVERPPVLHVNAFDEEVGVEGWLGHKGQQLAIARVNGHQCATSLAEEVFHHLL